MLEDRSVNKSILVVDDEPLVVKFIERVLVRSGFSVITATAPSEALAICADETIPIDVVLSDVIMPEMDGAQLGERIIRTRPAVRLVLMSGYTDLQARRMIAASPATIFLSKPFSMSTLLRAVGAYGDVPMASGAAAEVA
jgi:two-component system, cell cycle sensor histidine kinase and response regulator CckA